MKQKFRQKITAYLVIVAMLFTYSQPITVSAAEESLSAQSTATLEAGKAVYKDMGLISGYDSDANSFDFIYMGEYKKKGEVAKVPLKWRVLDDQTNTAESGYFLLSDGSMETIYFERTGDPVDRGGYTEYIYSTLWAQSDARMWCQDFAGTTTGSYKWGDTPSAFTALEQAAILPTSKSDSSYTSVYISGIGNKYETVFMEYNNILNNDKVFLPSAEELYNEAYGIKGGNVEVYTYLRSYPLPYEDNALEVGKMAWDEISVVNAFSDTFEGEFSYKMQECANSNSVTPALNMAPDKALFTMAADNSGQVDFALAKDYAGSEWKLTLKDSNNFADGAALSGETTLKPGESLTVTHKALSSFNAGYTNVTAALVDEAGNVCAYGSINNNTASTSSTLAIPANCADGTYTLMVSGEDWNAANYTNYGTGTPFTTTIKVSSKEALTGTVDIAGILEVGKTLEASVTGSNGAETLAYNWYREGSAASIGTGSTYTLTLDDYGKDITCKVTSDQHLGEISKTAGPVGQGTPDIGTVTANDLNDTLDVTQVILVRTDTSISGELKLTDTQLQYGSHTYNWEFTPENEGYKSITGTVPVTVNDTIAPTAKYQVNDSPLREFANFVTFGIFCKDTAVLNIEAEDSGTGIDTVKYYVSATEVEDSSTITAWEDYNGSVALNQKSKNYIYVQVKDKAGNVAVYEEGVVVYTESAAITTEAVEYIYKEGNDKEISVDFNGNTVKSIVLQEQDPLTETPLVEGTDYVVDALNNKIIIKASYLDAFNADDTAYSFQVKYSPVGVDTDTVDMATAFSVKVVKATLDAASGDVTAAGTYGDKLSELEVEGPSVTSQGNHVAGKWVLTGDTIPVVGDTGSYTATFAPDADAENYEELTKEVVLNIAKAEAEYTAPVAETDLVYQKEASWELISEGSTEHGTMQYVIGSSQATAPDDGWNAQIPTAMNAGTYYVWYKVLGDANHNDSEAQCVEVTIAKADANDITLPAKGYVYTIAVSGNQVELGTEVLADGGETAYAVDMANSNLDTYITNVQVDGNGKLTYDIAQAAAPVDGLYITVTVTSKNYNDYDIKLPIALSDKEAVSITLPTAQNSEYNHEPQTGYVGEPVVDGYDVAFDITYEGSGSTVYNATAEKPINAGDYKVTFTVDDSRVQGSAYLEFSILKGTPVLTDVEADIPENTTDINDITVTYQTDTWSEGQISIDDGQNLVYGNNSIEYTFTPDDTDNLNAVSGTVDVLVKDTIAPTVAITAVDKTWNEFFNNITFGLLFNETQQVTIVYGDNEGGSGLDQLLYYISDKELAAEQLEAVTWEAYNGAFNIDPDGDYVIYAKVVDKDGNVTIVNSDGIKLDETKPLLEGISDGEICYGDLAIKMSEAHPDVKSVTVDGASVTFEEGQYVIQADNEEHIVIVTDNAGNVTTYNVSVFKIYDVTFVVDDMEYLKVQVNHGADVDLPEIPEKAGYDKTAPKWNHDGKAIAEDTVITALYTKNPTEKLFVVADEKAQEQSIKAVNKLIEDIAAGKDSDKKVSNDIKQIINKALDDGVESFSIHTEVNIEYLEKGSVADAEVTLIEDEAGEGTVAQYFDLSVVVSVLAVGEDAPYHTKGNLYELDEAITFNIAIPKELQNVPEGVQREYYIIRVHDGVVEVLETTDLGNNVVSFETDRFSTYALAYKDTVKQAETPDKPAETPDKPAETPDKPAETPNKPVNPTTPVTPSTPDKPAETPAVPNTGNGDGMLPWMAIVALMGAVVVYLKRREN